MNCHEFKTWLVERDVHKESPDAYAMEHMEACKECKRLYALDSQVEQRIRDGLRQVEPSQTLYQRMKIDIDSAESKENIGLLPWKWKRFLPAVAMASLVLLLVFNPFVGRIGSLERMRSYALANHLDTSLSMAFTAQTVTDLSNWFSDRLGFPVALPKHNFQGVRFLGGRECYLGKKKAAYLFCEKSGKKISVFVIAADDLSFSVEEGRTYCIQDQEHEIKIWKENDNVFTMIT